MNACRNMTAYRWVAALALVAAVAGADTVANLPVTRVVLFSSGVGYFEREGNVEGNATAQLSFRTEQINDILKSLVLQDLGGGNIDGVTYAPQDPLEHTLSAFAVNISDNPTFAQLWDRLRGAQVKVTAGKEVYEGVVFGAEKQQRSAGQDKVIEFDVLNLLTDKGLREVPLWHVDTVQVLEAKLDGDLRKALAAMDAARDSNKRPVSLSFKGQGQRKVRVGYLLESPIWKTSYRLVTDEKGLFLQGWAIVENTSDDDWSDVSLALVSGRPISFTQDLYQPLYIPRPEVPPSVQAAARPRVWEGALEDAKEKGMAEEQEADASKGDRLLRKAAAPRRAGGMGGGMGMPGGMAAPAPPPATLGTAYRTTNALALREAGVEAAAEGGKVGTLFQYAIKEPVTVPRQRSAMIPIINGPIEGEKVSVYNSQVDAKHPMNGIKLKNSTSLHLMGGPITVFAGGVYGGDALVEDLAPGEERLITYAMDLAVEVAPESKSQPEQILSAKISRGVMTVQHKSRLETTYTIKNSAEEPRTLLVEHPVRPDWKLIEPKEPAEKTRSVYRFRAPVEPGKTAKLTVIEEMVQFEGIRLADRVGDEIKAYLIRSEISPKLKTALEKVVAMQGEIAALATQRTERETRIKEIEQEQDRIRKNMKELDHASELYKQYVAKLTEQETQFDKLREEVRQLRAQEAEKQKALQDYVMGLELE